MGRLSQETRPNSKISSNERKLLFFFLKRIGWVVAVCQVLVTWVNIFIPSTNLWEGYYYFHPFYIYRSWDTKKIGKLFKLTQLGSSRPRIQSRHVSLLPESSWSLLCSATSFKKLEDFKGFLKGLQRRSNGHPCPRIKQWVWQGKKPGMESYLHTQNKSYHSLGMFRPSDTLRGK